MNFPTGIKCSAEKKVRGTQGDMSNVDYKQIFNAAASALNGSSSLSIEAQDLDTYSADITIENGSVIKFTAILGEYTLELSVTKESIGGREYEKFMPRFEYNLEQKFFKNFKLEPFETSREYKIKISF